MNKSIFVFSLLAPLLSLFSSAAQATGIQSSLSPKYFAALSSNNASNSSETSPVRPIRQAKGKVVITKTRYVKNGNDYEKQIEIVCSKTADIPVFDGKDATSDRPPYPALIMCGSKVGTEPVHLVVGTAVVISISEPGKNDPAAAEFPELIGKPMKAAFGTLVVGADSARVATQDWASSAFSTLDLNLQTMMFELKPAFQSSWDCSDLAQGCKPKMMEYFSATLFIQD
jgi:hypothetical protein